MSTHGEVLIKKDTKDADGGCFWALQDLTFNNDKWPSVIMSRWGEVLGLTLTRREDDVEVPHP